MDNQPFFSKKRHVIFIAFLCTFLWGCAFPLVKICMDSFKIEPQDNCAKMLLAGIRFLCSGILTLSLSVHSKVHTSRSKTEKQDILWILLYGLLGTALQYAFTYIGLSNISGSVGALFDQLCVFLIILVSGLFFADDKLSFPKIMGCIFGFSGVALTVTDGLSLHFTFGGEGMMLCAAVAQTAAYILAKKTACRVPALKLVGLSHCFGGALLTVLAYALGGRITVISTTGCITLLLLIGISSGAYTLSLLPLKFFSASEISVFNLLIPIFGGIMSGICLQEDVFNIRYLFALSLVTVGIIFVNWHSQRRN